MPYHVALDRANEARLDGAKVGTTGRGIGPTYGDRAWRVGLRMEDLLDREVLRERLERLLPDRNLLLRTMGGETFEVGDLAFEVLEVERRRITKVRVRRREQSPVEASLQTRHGQ
jgi:adenylosuccinate synthase